VRCEGSWVRRRDVRLVPDTLGQRSHHQDGSGPAPVSHPVPNIRLPNQPDEGRIHRSALVHPHILATDWIGCDHAAIFRPALAVSPARSSNPPPGFELASNVPGPRRRRVCLPEAPYALRRLRVRPFSESGDPRSATRLIGRRIRTFRSWPLENLARTWPQICGHQWRAGCEDHPARVNLGVIVKATRKRTASRRSGTAAVASATERRPCPYSTATPAT
jgi:hypothetical protein